MMAHSQKVVTELKEILDVPLQVSQSAFVFAEIVTGELVFVGISEFRDAVFHVSRALWTDNEDEALKNIDEAFEHIRRAGVESIEWAAAKRYREVKRVIKTPFLLSKLMLGKKKSDILQIERGIRELFIEGRAKKSEKAKWIDAIHDYKQAVEKADKLYELCPTKVEYYFKLFFVIAAFATLITLAIDLFLLLK